LLHLRNAQAAPSVSLTGGLHGGRVLGYENLLTWVIIGAVSGWLAGLIVEGYGFGLLGNMLVGSLGAVIAGIGVWALGIYVDTTLGNIIAVTMGAVALLLLVGLVRRTPGAE
jgi:uncharacterized membrane protein YeaQ/YmgE (transglycosylase-associated protein family)